MSAHNAFRSMSHPGADVQVKDPGASGAISNSRSGICFLTTAAAETRTLAAPTHAGLMLGLNLMTDGGNCVVTVAGAATVLDGTNNTITLNDAGDFILLMSVKLTSTTFRWALVANNGTSLSSV